MSGTKIKTMITMSSTKEPLLQELSDAELLESYEKELENHEQEQTQASFLQTDDNFEEHFRKIFGTKER